ncbi:FG-GAP repeat protein [Actinoplanes subglobosus]|uniref:FG-GAP repeat protein n=1 Tax=Actinoplanes subglobosus TaxID=1547892 RepID=A0ABV8ITB5_9ACTN
MRRLFAVLLAAPLLMVPAAAPASAACARVPGDFNGDGFGDLAVGSPNRNDTVNGAPWEGAVNIAYGSAAGIGKGSLGSATYTGHRDIVGPGFDGSLRLGEALATGYFDGDCYADLAVSAASGSKFLLLYGSEWGLTTARATGMDRTDIQPDGEYGSGLSYDLAAGDFNGDGFDDIAAGAPLTDGKRGAVGVLYGSAAGISGTGSQWITQDSPGVPGAAEPDDIFGWSVAAGDFNGDGRDELVAGAPGETLGGKRDAGGIVVLPGSAAGVSTTASTWWDQDSPGVPGAVERYDQFGYVLATGDTGADGRDELIVSAHQEAIGSKTAAGAVQVFRGSTSGLVPGAMFSQDDAAIPGSSESGDYFGSALVLADLDRDGKRDLVIGVRGETAGSAQGTGAINVLFSAATGPVAAGSIYLDQNSAGVPGANESQDGFGWGLSRLANAYGGDALVVGVPDEKVTYASEGAVVILPGAAGRTRPAGFSLTGANFPGRASAESNFGWGLPS